MKGMNKARIFTADMNYRVVPMRGDRHADAARLSEALSKGFVAQKDPDREGFYSVRLGKRAFYIHAHEATKTLYILKTAPASLREKEVRPPLEYEQRTADCMPS